MAELKRLTLIAALSSSSAFGLAQSVTSSSSTTKTTSTRTKVRQTTNYIDTIDGYSSLSSCAIDVLSTVVRGEFSGCGGWDDNLTSYTCFCTDSYSSISTVISTDVLTSCAGDSAASAQATSALSIFDDYCALGVEAGLEPTSDSATQDATATPGATGASAAQTASADSAADSRRTTAIAAGVVVPVVVIALAVITWLIWRKRRRANATSWDQWNKGNGNSAYANTQVREANAVEAPTYENKTVEAPYSPHHTSEMSAQSPHSASELSPYQYAAQEMPADQQRQELPG
ncbi:hypothetical protein diail_1669 [Diaporthe ilicicola]|nr:hypothetical protein diail_1669 [Diaporthe ilicicola]